MKSAITVEYGQTVGDVFILLSAAQFHLPFYASRMLPNTFAMILTNVAMAAWIQNPRQKFSLYLLLFATVRSDRLVVTQMTMLFQICFRCDALLLLLPFLAHLLLKRHITVWGLVWHLSVGALLSLSITVSVDSFFWGRWVWPEGEVFYFNAILQRYLHPLRHRDRVMCLP